MRKSLCVLLALLFIGVNSYSQKKNGTVYSEHEAIDRTKELWDAFVKADKEKYVSLLADSLYAFSNGKREEKEAAADVAKGLDWWKNEEAVSV